MNTWRKRPVTQIVTDAGPLIDLAAADRLDLLQSFGRPVLVVDVVREECLQKLGAPGEERLAHWFHVGGGNQFQLITTPFLDAYKTALLQVKSGKDPAATKGMGDATIAWLLANLRRLKAPTDIALLLTQDSAFGDGPIPGKNDVHVLSTRQWLNTLERLNVIESARAIIDEIEDGGRRVARYQADRPAQLGPGTKSDWRDGAAQTHAESLRDSACSTCGLSPCACSKSGMDFGI